MIDFSADPVPEGGLDVGRVAEVLAGSAGEWRSSGYLVASGLVLTVAHGAPEGQEVRVRFDADRPGDREYPAAVVWRSEAVDLAVLAVAGDWSVASAPLGRLTDGRERVSCSAVGFPRHKLRSHGHPEQHYRDVCHTFGYCNPASQRREGTLDLIVPAPRETDGGPSPWAGMSGAAVWSYGRIVGVVSHHHTGDGPSHLAASRIDRWHERLAPAALGELEGLLGASLAPEHLPEVCLLEGAEPFRHSYTDALMDTLGRLELFGVTMSQPDFGYQLSTAYISLTATESTGGHSGPMGALRVEEAIGASQRVLIRGDAGSGKTTLLQKLAINALTRDFPSEMRSWNGLVPFFLPLRHFATRPHLPTPEEFLDYSAPLLAGDAPPGYIRELLNKGRAVLLIDGVDEFPMNRRGEVKQWLRELVRTYRDCRHVVTSRQAAVGEDWLKSLEFKSLELQPMSIRDQNRFIRYWHGTMRHGKPDEVKESLRQHEQALLDSLSVRRDLRRIGSNPLFCALLCALNWDRRMQLPADRMGLYAAALEMLLVRRDAERKVPPIPGTVITDGLQRILLSRLAYWMIRNGLNEVSRSRLEERITRYLTEMGEGADHRPADVLSHLLERTGLLRFVSSDQVNFVHRSFQEYLAAEQVLHDGDLDSLIRNAHEDKWQDVAVMAVGHAFAPQCNELVSGLLARIRCEPGMRTVLTLLALDCANNGRAKVSPALQAEVGELARELLPPQDEKQAMALSSLGEVVLDLLPGPEGLRPNEVAAVLRTCVLSREPAALRVMSRFCRDASPEVEKLLLDAVFEFDPAEFSEAVLAHLPWHQPLVVRDSELEWLRGLSNLRRLKVGRATSSYAALVDLGLRELTLNNPTESLPGFPEVLPLERFSVVGAVRAGSFSGLRLPGLREATTLVVSHLGSSWELVARWPAETRADLRHLVINGWPWPRVIESLGLLLPRLEELTIHTSQAHTRQGFASLLRGLASSSSRVGRLAVVFSEQETLEQFAELIEGPSVEGWAITLDGGDDARLTAVRGDR